MKYFELIIKNGQNTLTRIQKLEKGQQMDGLDQVIRINLVNSSKRRAPHSREDLNLS